MTSVAVCIPTFRRPQSLHRLLDHVSAQARELGVHVVIIDNDAAGSARKVADEFRSRNPQVSAHYVIEPRRGLASVRNAAVRAARGLRATFLVFIDDDEWPEPTWLQNLVAAASQYGADVVAGPVAPVYPPGTPSWVIQGSFFERPRYATGARVQPGTTANLLISLDVLDSWDRPFDPQFDLTSGEDIHLLERLARRGAVMVWQDEALVHEEIFLSRARAAWILRRAFRGGETFARAMYAIEPSARGRAARAVRSLARLGFGILALVTSLPRGRAATVRALADCCVGLGGIAAIVGLRHHEYRVVHGR